MRWGGDRIIRRLPGIGEGFALDDGAHRLFFQSLFFGIMHRVTPKE